jgi:hypothetical protein
MDKEFVTYEVALALKELGYDDTPWFGNQASLYDVDGEHTMYTNYGVMYSGLSDGYIPAPLKQQVFRWFREKYEVYATITTETGEGLYHHFIIQGNDAFFTWSKIYYTYEEAENACIDKLIEIAKQQDNDKQ